MTDRDQRELEERTARQVCTEREFEAYFLWSRGAGYRRIAQLLGISFSTARDRVHRARPKVAAALESPDTKEAA